MAKAFEAFAEAAKALADAIGSPAFHEAAMGDARLLYEDLGRPFGWSELGFEIWLEYQQETPTN